MKGLHDKDVDRFNVPKAKQYALKLLSYRGRSEKELEDRLKKKGFSKTIAFSVINNLKKSGLIDDMALAETLKREALTSKLLSQKGAKTYMLQRGIPRDIIDQVLRHDENIDIQNARRLIEKKLKAIVNYPSEVVKRRLYNLLLRRGYSSETIVILFKNIKTKEDET